MSIAQTPDPGGIAGKGRGLTVVTNHIGYETSGPKQAILVGAGAAGSVLQAAGMFELVRTEDMKVVYSGRPVYRGAVKGWKDWQFRVMDFSKWQMEGEYIIRIAMGGQTVSSYPFTIASQVLERNTISDLIYYFKGQRCAGLFDQADHRLPFGGRPGDSSRVDAHGGWYNATGDYGKHLSQLSFATYFNTQQIPLTVWGLLKSYEWLGGRGGTDFRQYRRRLMDEAMYGADYLVRIKAPEGSFYRSVLGPGPGKLARDRIIDSERKAYRIWQSKDQAWSEMEARTDPAGYQTSYRSGGGVAIAALALAASFDTSGEYSSAEYLQAAERAFAFLEAHNDMMLNDGRENIVDDYCALLAATELYKATKKSVYRAVAERRALRLTGRLQTWKEYRDYWRADEGDRPYFNPSDAGLPLVSLMNYYPVASESLRTRIKGVVARSMAFELRVTGEVNNPFGYARQLVQDTAGKRWSAFFFPHGSEASPWWQGENARLASMAAAARMGAILLKGEGGFADSLRVYGEHQLDWILGLNPYDACMLEGKGHNNPAYAFFGTFEYTNAPGGIVNGITSGFDNEEGIDFNIPYAKTGKDNDWRWVEQWLPHATWFLLAVSIDGEELR